MTHRALATLAVVALATAGSIAWADPPANTLAKEASTHFQRGVSLFNEADYRAALVEFRRAYDIAPKTAVLYNIGQTYYQLQNYAAALTALQRYLAESPAGASHRTEVLQTLETLTSRIGKLAITTNVPGCELTIDDEPAGTSPLREPVVVSVGRRKVTATHGGRADSKLVEVAAGDTAKVSFVLAPDSGTPVAPATSSGDRWIVPGWIATGVLGAGALTSGVVAYLASRDLNTARGRSPGSPAELGRLSSRVTTYGAVADILGVAAIVTGGITLKLTLSRSSTHELHVALRPDGLQLAGSFE